MEHAGRRSEVNIARHIKIRGDRELLVQMLANIIENAIRYTSTGSAIRVSLAASPTLVLTVADTGPGIPDSEKGRVFERFYRSERSRTTPGNGLGLSIVAAVAGLHGIAISLEDNNPGLRVRMRFASETSAARSPVPDRAPAKRRSSLPV